MSEMFTKIGGFIASGDPLVYSDSATMTGNGTVAEPFGVKATDLYVQEPLFTGTSGSSAYIGWKPDETVLWTGNKDETGGGDKNHWNIVLSEPVSAFERLRIHYMQQIGNIRDYASIEIDVYDNSAAYRVPAWPENQVNSNWMSMNIQLTGNSGFYEGAYNPYTANVNNPTLSNCWLAGNFNKVVGINRKSEA